MKNVKDVVDKISINTHTSIKISDTKIIYIDPYNIEEDTHDADIIFITHSHYDHLSPESINIIMNDRTKFIVPSSIEKDFNDSDIELYDTNEVIYVDVNNDYTIDNISFKVVPSYNEGKNFHKKEFGFVGYILDIDDALIYIAGDTDINNDNKNIKCDIALLPIGGTYTMDYKEAAKLINIIKPSVVIPTHYGSVVGDKEDFNKFKKEVDSSIEVVEKIF